MGLIKNPTIPDDLCTLQTCSLLQAHFQYIPTLAGNALYLGIFGLLLAVQVFIGVKHRTWGFLGGMIGGIVLEIIGYVGRIQMHYNPFTSNPFLMWVPSSSTNMMVGALRLIVNLGSHRYLVCLTIGPAFLSASIYLCLARVVVVFSEDISRFRPAVYTITFVCCDFFSLLLQAAGGAIASGANTPSQNQTGINIMIAGLSTQVASLVLFLAFCAEFGLRCYQHAYDWEPSYSQLRSTLQFKSFLVGKVPWNLITRLLLTYLPALFVSTVAILIRSCFRVAELRAGFHGALANNETLFMVLDGVMIILAITFLTILHPGVAFQGHWSAANFTLRKSKGQQPTDNEGRFSQREAVDPKRSLGLTKLMPGSFSSKSKKSNAIVAEKHASQNDIE